MSQTCFFLENWKVEPQLNRISPIEGGAHIQLEPQLMRLLLFLVENQGNLVSKESLLQEVWSEVIVGENVLTRAISSLRKALGDQPQTPIYIETISKTGYRLIAKVNYPEKTKKKDDTVKLTLKKRSVIISILVLALLLFGAFTTWRVLSPKTITKVLHPVVLANTDMPEYYPAISRDGQFVAYASKDKGNNNWDVYIKRIGTESLVKLTNNPAVEMRAVWSEDGANVYYIRYEPSEKTIYKSPMTGGKETRVVAASRFSYGNFDIAPNQNEMAFNNREENGTPLRIELTDLEFGNRHFITNPPKGFNGDIHPTYSPDGSKIGFIRERNSVSMYLFVIDLKSGETTQITKEHLSINGFDWSPDGKSIIYSTDKTGIYKLWKIDLKNLQSELLPASDYQMVMPRISENNKTIYAKLQDNVNIWSYSLDTQEAKSWRASNDLDLNPSYSSDGSKAAFTTNRSGSFQLWTSNADGTEPIVITNFNGQFINAPRWSHDGTEIVFQGYFNGQSNIYKVNTKGGIPEKLTHSEDEKHTPFYSPDNSQIYYSSNASGNWEIWRMTADGNSKTQITTTGGYAPQLSSNNPFQVFYVKKDTLGIWSKNMQSGIETLEIPQFVPKKYGAFTLSNKGIYYLNAGTRTIDFLDMNTQENISLIQPKRISPFGITISYSEASNTLLYAQVDHIDSDIMLLEER